MADSSTDTGVDINSLYAQNPGIVPTDKATNAQAVTTDAQTSTGVNATATNAAATNATGTGYAPTTGTLSQAADASNQVNKITSQDSPLMQQAKQTGILTAASRGLENSSLAAGSAEAAEVQAATPLAQQNAQEQATQDFTNQAAQNTASQFGAAAANTASGENAQLGTSTSVANAQQQNQIAAQNAAEQTQVNEANAAQQTQAAEQAAGLQTQTNQFNASNQQGVNNLNAAASNQMQSQVLSANSTLNQQFLADSQSMSLAQIQERYQQLISTNQAATNLYSAMFASIGNAMNNPSISPDALSTIVTTQQGILQAGLDLIDKINGGTNPGTPGAVNGGNTTGTPVGGAPVPGGTPPALATTQPISAPGLMVS